VQLIPVGSNILTDPGPNQETNHVAAVAGAGPFRIRLYTNLLSNHPNGAPVQYQGACVTR